MSKGGLQPAGSGRDSSIHKWLQYRIQAAVGTYCNSSGNPGEDPGDQGFIEELLIDLGLNLKKELGCFLYFHSIQ